MGDAGQHQQQRELGQATVAERGDEAGILGNLFEGEQEAEDEAGDGLGGEEDLRDVAVEVARA